MKHSFRFSAFAAIALAIVAGTAGAQTSIDIPLVELPYNVEHGIRAPGMQQSLAITTDFYEYTNAALGRIAPKHKTLTKVGITVADFFTMAVPFADAWEHEEWHRAVIGQRGIDSKDDVWNLKNIFASSISVSHIKDEDLIRLKRDHPADFVRAKAAGLEGETELITNMESKAFFSRSRTFHTGLYWLIALNDALYVGLVTSPTDSAELDSVTIDANLKEKTIAERDLSGHDFTAWVYHLFRPTEPLTARGTHPTGVGLDRYIKVADLSPEEKKYIRRAGRMMILNFVDPNLFGQELTLNGGAGYANFALKYMLTSFGDVVQAHLLYEQGSARFHITGQRYANHDKAFPGLQIEAVEIPVRLGKSTLAVSPRASGWMQPKDQLFMTTDSKAGGLLGARIETRGASRLQLYVDAELKSAGWVAGRPSLDQGGTFRTGLTYALGEAR